MTTLLIKHAYIVTMDDHQREIPDGGLFMRDGFIEQVAGTAELPATADEVMDLNGHVVLPGLVNTHHHFYQTLTRNLPAVQDAKLFGIVKRPKPDSGPSALTQVSLALGYDLTSLSSC